MQKCIRSEMISMSYYITVFKKEIEGVEFELRTAQYVQLSKLLINGEPVFVQDVDIAEIIRAINNYDTLYFIRDEFKGIWGEEQIIELINEWIGFVDGAKQ